MQEKLTKLEKLNGEYLTRCKELATENTIVAKQPTQEEAARLQQEREAIEQIRETFEANKVGWVHAAAHTIAANAYRLLRNKPLTTKEPPQDFLDICIDDAIATLDLEQSDHD